MKRTIIGVIVVIGGFLLVVQLLPSLKESECIWYVKFKNLELNGVVIKKYIDSTEHSFPFFEVKQFDTDSVKKVGIVGDTSNSFEKIIVGDTIIKIRGSDFIKLQSFRRGEILKIDFGCAR